MKKDPAIQQAIICEATTGLLIAARHHRPAGWWRRRLARALTQLVHEGYTDRRGIRDSALAATDAIAAAVTTGMKEPRHEHVAG